MPTKQHITLEAKATATEQGEFVALAAAYSVDRAGDRIVPGAFSKTIAHWQGSGKRVPLHWNHESGPESIIGSVDPYSLIETDAGLQVSGNLDLKNSAKAKEAWRAMKTDSMSLSFGYMVVSQQEDKSGVNALQEIDLFEVSVVPGPANADTRFLALKSITDMGNAEIRAEIQELHKRLDELESATEEPQVDDREQAPPEDSHQALDPEAVAIDIECIDALTN
jgi:HK97 family phage prohead protease